MTHWHALRKWFNPTGPLMKVYTNQCVGREHSCSRTQGEGSSRSELLNHLSYAAIKNARLTVTVQEYSCVYVHRDDRIEVARGKFMDKGAMWTWPGWSLGYPFSKWKHPWLWGKSWDKSGAPYVWFGGNRPHKVEAVTVAENLNSLIARFRRVRNQVEQSM